MKKPRIISSGNLAFVIVVGASYLSAITTLVYSRRAVPAWEATLLIAAAAAYLIVGTYGFTLCRRRPSRKSAAIYFIVQLVLAATLIKLRGHAGELSLILLPLAGQNALLLPLSLMIAVCALVYVLFVMPLIMVSRWVDA